LFGRIDVDTPTRMYVYSVVLTVLVFLARRGIRRSRTGRVIVALRENDRAAMSFAVSPVRAKLTAFVISGTVAGIGGALLTHQSHAFKGATYGTGESLTVFITAVIGGLGSLGGAFLGAGFLRGVRWFIHDERWQLLSTSVGVLLVLLVLPGGLGGLWIKVRGAVVRRVTRGTSVPAPEPVADDVDAPEELVEQPA
jgi:branched-chain amino acid transport system permease protein